MFSYQPEKSYPFPIAGVYNSRTELMTREIFWQLVTSPQTAWLVAKHREVKHSLEDAKWLEDEDFKAYDRKMRSKPKSKAGLAYLGLKDEGKRVAAWCQDLKTRLPYAIFIGTYPERACKKGGEKARWRNQKFIELNGLVSVDFDHITSPDPSKGGEVSLPLTPSPKGEGEACGGESRKTVREIWHEAWERLDDEDRKRVLLAFVSPGGDGLKVIIKGDETVGNLIDNQIVFAGKAALKVDTSCKDAARGTFLTTKEDIIMINEEELFTYENKTFHEKFAAQYRRGDSQPTLPFAADGTNSADSRNLPAGAVPVATAGNGGDGGSEDAGALTYHGVPYAKICEALLGGKEPGEGDRHATSLKLASDLRYITDNDAKLIERILRSLKWVDDIVRERGEDVAGTVKSAMEYKYYMTMPKRIAEALVKAGVTSNLHTLPCTTAAANSPLSTLNSQLEQWGKEIETMFGDFPCLRECCQDLRPAAYPAALFVSAAFLGTDMTRTWWYFWHRPEQQRRMNYCIFIIGDPGVGKSFATRLYKLLAAPLIAADKVGNDAVNRYKKEVKKRTTSTKEQKKEALEQPDVVVRVMGSRTANGVFIENMNKAVEIIEGTPLHLHLLTFDSELDSATTASKGGQWIDKSVMELKAFHNEEDDQQYRNVDSLNGPFDVYWNFVYTGTPLSLKRKVTERNFGSGLATRLAVIPFPPSNFQMLELRRQTKVNHAADELLKTWAFRLDHVSGELPLWALAEHTWQWMSEKMEVAAFNGDKADEMLLKRVPYYGICVAAPFILMRHWDEWQEKKTFEIDDTDRRLCTLAMEIQHYCQLHYFGRMAQAYFENSERDEENGRRRPSKYDQCYEQLPEEFTTEDVVRIYEQNNENAAATCQRLKKKGYVSSLAKGHFKKLKPTIYD